MKTNGYFLDGKETGSNHHPSGEFGILNCLIDCCSYHFFLHILACTM